MEIAVHFGDGAEQYLKPVMEIIPLAKETVVVTSCPSNTATCWCDNPDEACPCNEGYICENCPGDGCLSYS